MFFTFSTLNSPKYCLPTLKLQKKTFFAKLNFWKVLNYNKFYSVGLHFFSRKSEFWKPKSLNFYFSSAPLTENETAYFWLKFTGSEKVQIQYYNKFYSVGLHFFLISKGSRNGRKVNDLEHSRIHFVILMSSKLKRLLRKGNGRYDGMIWCCSDPSLRHRMGRRPDGFEGGKPGSLGRGSDVYSTLPPTSQSLIQRWASLSAVWGTPRWVDTIWGGADSLGDAIWTGLGALGPVRRCGRVARVRGLGETDGDPVRSRLGGLGARIRRFARGCGVIFEIRPRFSPI